MPACLRTRVSVQALAAVALVEPLVKDLEPVVEDYFAFFSSSIDEIKSTDACSLTPIIEDLRRLREQMLLARVKVQQLADAIEATTSDRQLKEFARRVLAIFFCTRHASGGKASRSTTYIDFLEHLPPDSVRRSQGDLVDAARQTKDEIAHAWLQVSQTYGALRLDSVK